MSLLISIVGFLAVLLAAVVFLPELPLCVLVAGMSLWHIIPVLNRFPILEGNVLILTVLIAFAVLSVNTAIRKGSWVVPRFRIEDLFLFAFCLWLALGTMWSDSPDYGRAKFLTFAAYTLSGYVMVRLVYPNRTLKLERIAVLISIIGLTQAILALSLVRLGNNSLLLLEIPRRVLKDVGLNPIYETKALVIAVLATLWLINLRSTSRSWTWPCLVPLLFVLLLALTSYGQRGAVLSLATASIFMLFGTAYIAFRNRPTTLRQKQPVDRNKVLFIGLITGILLVVVLLVLSPIFLASNLAKDDSFLLRLHWYRIGFSEFMSAPLAGVGTGGMGDLGEDEFQFYVHNRLLELLAENGLIGFAFLFVLTVAIAARAYKTITGEDQQTAYKILLPASVLLHEYSFSMFSTDLSTWSIGVWMALIVCLDSQPRLQILRIVPLRSRGEIGKMNPSQG